ncbi:lipopolysaccharide biosynthesis regulator YciM [Dyadobacter jejuensis]|uniref:Lipopolysaccharide biosynthesis regulator YciM n=1 Tax=Dyadobacter jejuensis TaxID=1082580 RepID=A0A316A8B1_9BACT|nr:tetratricopeptide repeat protein [Dyadobacter jejuensis]PWJ53732.1 lipopolysaccharide biosynthesis regulator YciM [Dyadobacter jejuensis]
MRQYALKIPILIIIVLLNGISQEGYAQRRSKKKALQTEKSEQVTTGLQQEALVAEGMKFMMKDEPVKALPLFEKLIDEAPLNPTGYYLTAKALLEINQVEEAFVASKKAYELNKDNDFYAQQLAELYAKKRKYAEAAVIYETLIKKSPENIQYGLELAAIYVFNDEFDKAIRTYDILERALGVSEEITKQKQQLYLRQNQLEEAIAEARKLIESEPEEVSYQVEFAELLIANDRTMEAIAPLEEAIRINPDEAQAHVLLADIYRKNGNIEKCNQELKIVFANPNLDADPKIRVLSGYLSMLKTSEENNDALLLAKQLMDTHPGVSKVHVIYADLLMRNKRKAEARDAYVRAANLDPSVFEIWGAILQLDGELNQPDSLLAHSEQALEVFPNQGMFWYSNGMAHLINKNYKESVSSLEESLKLVGEQNEMVPYIYGQLGDAFNGLGDHAKSDASYELSLKANPENDHVLNNYSYFLSLRKEKLDLALKMSGKLVKLYQNNPTYLDTHAWVLYTMKDYKRAKEYLEMAMKDSTAVSGTIVEHYGDVLFKLGEHDNAVAQWKKARSMGETTELLDKKIATGSLHEQ